MKIAVVAGNGRSGRAFVRAALDGGHTVNAGYYGGKQPSDEAGLSWVQCDATNKAQLSELVRGCDAAVSLIGHVKGSPPTVQTDAMQLLCEVMKTSGISRLISLTGTGVRMPGDKITLVDRVLNLSIGIIDPRRVADGKKHVEVLRRSGLDWTVVRVLKLQDTTKKPYVLTENGPTKVYVGREEVASAILEVLDQRSFVQKLPIISPVIHRFKT